MAAFRCLEAAGVPGVRLAVGSVGCARCRPGAVEALRSWLSDDRPLCDDCARRLSSNPLRALDCKDVACSARDAGAPTPSEMLCAPCATELASVVELIAASGISAQIDTRLVRGLDYYEGVVFELEAPCSQGALAGGGRYGPLVGTGAGVGWALGVERVAELLDLLPELRAGVGFAAMEGCEPAVMAAASQLRARGLRCVVESGRSPGAMVKALDAAGVAYAVLVGSRELSSGSVMVKDLRTGAREEVVFGADELELFAREP